MCESEHLIDQSTGNLRRFFRERLGMKLNRTEPELSIGQSVPISEGPQPIKGIITAIMAEGTGPEISYRVSFWNGRTRCLEWFGENELLQVQGK